MNISIDQVTLNQLGAGDKARLESFLKVSDNWMVPALSQRTDLSQYADKILRHGVAVMAMHSNGSDIGMVAFYCNDDSQGHAFITHLAVDPDHRRGGLGKKLTEYAMRRSQSRGMKSIALEVSPSNESARRLYASCGFVESETRTRGSDSSASIFMICPL